MYIWIIAALVAFFIKGLCGFANTLVFTSILGFRADNVNISPVELILGYPANLILVWKNRKLLEHRIWLPLSLLLLAGSIPGALLLKNVDAGALKIVFGVMVILIALEMLLREFSSKSFEDFKPLRVIIGLLSGIMCGLFGIGALLAAYVSRVTGSGNEFKANISAVFFVENTFRIILYGILGIFTFESLKQSLILMPFVLLGLFAGIFAAKFLNEKTAKILVILLLIISGAVLIFKNI